jgi:hypothetical protein
MINNWFYTDINKSIIKIKSIDDFPKGCVGFIYRITNLNDGRFYIGRKILKNTNKVKISKKELLEVTGKGRKPLKKTVVKESNWIDYYGSCKPLLTDIAKLGIGTFKREIIKFCFSKKQMTYEEMRQQIYHQVLEKPQCTYNENIAGKFFSKDLLVP